MLYYRPMCGIVGYIGPRNITSILLVGLERLSYRGYDSAGIAVLSDGELSHWKKEGKIHHLSELLKPLDIAGDVGIGHTRWATHGVPDVTNAHPQICPKKKTALVHNGIIENYLSLKKKLIAEGHIFRSQTDTEVIVHLIDRYLDQGLETAVEKATQDLVGTYAIAIISEQDPGKIVVCRKGSPLIIGLGEGENFVSSDIHAIAAHTKNVIYLEDDELGTITKDKVIVKKVLGPQLKKEIHQVSWTAETTKKGGYSHYMLKEIHEQPDIVRKIILKHVRKDNTIVFPHLKLDTDQLAKISRFLIQACGTSWHAGLICKYLFERYARVPTEVDISSEFRYRQLLMAENELVVAISQSGETADTLACIREAKSKFFRVMSLVNVEGSSIDRESDAVIHTHSGPEIGVASTKNYVAQLTNIYLFSLFLGQIRETLSDEDYNEKVSLLKKIPVAIEKILSQSDKIKAIAKKYHKHRSFIFIGRNLNYPTALEGALKLKEISYIHATGYAAGELKHGPIALIDSDMPVICICPRNSTYDKMISNIQEIKARGAQTIIIATEGDKDLQALADDIIWIPECHEDNTPILAVIPLQLFSFYTALFLGCDVDQPRNLAKSVTVE